VVARRRINVVRRIAYVALGLTLALAVTDTSAQAPDPTGRGLRRGMTPAEVRQLLGTPTSISRQILFRRHLEQWLYDDPAVRVEFNCVRGEEAVVRAILRK